MESTNLPEKVLALMYNMDGFSQWLGIEKMYIDFGTCTLRMKVRSEMLNGFSIAHGGISYSLADSALAFASNSYGIKAVSIHTSIEHLKAIFENDILIAQCVEKSKSNKIASYEVIVKNQNEEIVALFHGMVFIKGQLWEISE